MPTDLVSGPCAEEEMDWARILAYITGTVDQRINRGTDHDFLSCAVTRRAGRRRWLKRGLSPFRPRSSTPPDRSPKAITGRAMLPIAQKNTLPRRKKKTH